ncbi:MAG: zinc transport system ATP-binding protein [Parcubacteria group bacterium Licking1014_17]|nr:MAG: zinc transport system ATP-binding protein [Parcubacteria group bacterium Licking1014_17]
MDGQILKVENLEVTLNEQKILENVNFDVHRGEVLAIVGPNGAGKTTLFKALLGLVPHSGLIKWMDGIKIGYVPQKLYIEHGIPLTVKEFLSLKTNSFEEIKNVLNAVGIVYDETHEHHVEQHILNRPMELISSGESQRVLIAWALIGNPDVLLFDEPTAGIDIGGKQTIYHLIHNLQETKKLTVILISHDLNVVYQYANEVVCLNRKQICIGTPKETLDHEHIQMLYGGKTSFYQHVHKEH